MVNDTDVQRLRSMAGLVTPMALRVAVTLGLLDRLRADRAEPVPAEPVPAEPVPVDPAPAEPAPAEPVPAEPELAAATDATAAGNPPAAPLLTSASTAPGLAAFVAHLAAELNVNPTALELLLGHLVTLGVVDRTETGYRTTEFGALLCEDAGNGLHNLLHHDTAAGRADLAFVDLAHSVRTGEPAYPLRYGQDFWTDLDEWPHLREAFDRQMTWRLGQQVPRFVDAVDWSRFATIVDVGGGPGDLLAAVLAAYPETRGHLVDLEIGPALRNFESLAGRARATAGSFFDPLPPGDAYVLFDILHDWDDEQAHRILARCAEAAGPDSRVILVESIRGMGISTEMDLVMLVHFGGRERSIEELAKLAEPHGLVLDAATRVTDTRYVLEFRKHPI